MRGKERAPGKGPTLITRFSAGNARTIAAERIELDR